MNRFDKILKNEVVFKTAERIVVLRTAPWETVVEILLALRCVATGKRVLLGEGFPKGLEPQGADFCHWRVSGGFLSLFKMKIKHLLKCRAIPFDVVVVPCRNLTGDYENVLEMLPFIAKGKIFFISERGEMRSFEICQKKRLSAFLKYGQKELKRLLKRRKERRRRGISGVKRWLKRDGQKYFFRPHALKIETTNICNAKCSFCLYPGMRRKKEILPMEIFRKAVDDYAAMGGGALSLSPVVGEILLDPHLLERLRYARTYKQITSIGFYTNMIALSRWTDDAIREILSLLDGCECSLAPNREVYQELYGVDLFETVVSNLERLALLAEGVSSRPRISLQGRALKADERVDDRLLCLAERLTESRRFPILSTYANWGGEVQNLPATDHVREKISSVRKAPCSSPFEAAVVLSNGTVGLCPCADGNGVLVIGDLKKNTLSEILSGKKRQEGIESFMNGKLNPFCAQCTFYRALNPDEVSKWPAGGNAFHRWPIRSVDQNAVEKNPSKS